MLLAEITNALLLVWSHRAARISVLLIIFVSLLLSIFFSVVASVIILASYLGGCVVSFCLIKYKYEVGFCLHRLASIYHGHLAPEKKFDKGCNICDDLYCNRHQSNINKEPWKGIVISNELNQAIEDFYNKILENFVTSWYSSITEDKTFIYELRYSFRYASSTIVNRFMKVDLGKLITNKLIPCALRHIHDYLQIQEISKKENRNLENTAAEYLGKRLHAAVTNRENELAYLRYLTSCLLPHVVPKSHLDCKSYILFMREIISGWVFLPLMDVISDPNIMNILVNITANYKKSNHPKIIFENDSKVEFMYNFTNYMSFKKAALGHDLSRILKSSDMLYSFMQFLKAEGPVNVLQFCLDVEEFNKKLLTPDISKIESQKLHAEAMQIYETYLKESSFDAIGCPSEICASLKHLLQNGAHNVTRLRTSTPLYQAYDYAFGLLESKWLPLFYHSDKFYELVCGQRVSTKYQKTVGSRYVLTPQGSPVRNRNKKSADTVSQGAVSKISNSFNRIKGVLRTQPVEGAVYQTEAPTFETVPSLFVEQNSHRDLSAWRISISHVEHTAGSKPIFIFFISVKRIDSCKDNERSWTIQRHDQDFYTLKIKLVEFHGENEISDSPLPSRRATTPIETRKQKYEQFLQKLLQKPSLRGSDLLHMFLTTKQNFSVLADTSMPLVSDLGNIYQSVTHKLRKEKGQHLDNFMSTFLQSTETGKSKTSKFESPDVGEEPDTGTLIEETNSKSRDLKSSVFGNNFGVDFPKESACTQMTFSPSDIVQCSLYLLSSIFHAPLGVLRLFTAICGIAHEAIDYFCKIIIEHQIKAILSEQTLAHLINMLQDVLFHQKFTPPTKYELEQRKVTAFHNIANMKRGMVSYWLGIEVNTGLATLLEILQSPQLNKQLTYSLLDIIILDMFPDCNLSGLSS